MSAAFDQVAASYDRQVQESISFSGLKHDFFLRAKADQLGALFRQHFGDHKPSLLDVGCGIGRMHPLLRPFTGSLAGSDVSAQSLAQAAEDNPGETYRPAIGSALPWDDAALDATLAVCVFHHVALAERPGLIDSMKRVTRPGGLVILIEHNPVNPLTRLAVSRCPFDHDAILLGAGEARAKLARQGLQGVSSRHFLLLPTAKAWARSLESATTGLPLGAQYIAWGVV